MLFRFFLCSRGNKVEGKGERTMKGTSKATGHAVSMPVGIAWGTGTALALTMVLSVLEAWMIHREVLRQQSIGYGVMGILLVSVVIGSAVAKRKIKRRLAAAALLTGLCYYFCLLSITALFFGGQYSGMGVTGLLILGGSGAAAAMGKTGIRRGKKLRFSR